MRIRLKGKVKAKGVNPERKSGAGVSKMDGAFSQILPELSDVDEMHLSTNFCNVH